MEEHLQENLKEFFNEHDIKKITDFPVSSAYIVFESLDDKITVFNELSKHNHINPWKRIFFCLQKKDKTANVPKNLLFKGKHLLEVEDGEEPLKLNFQKSLILRKLNLIPKFQNL